MALICEIKVKTHQDFPLGTVVTYSTSSTTGLVIGIVVKHYTVMMKLVCSFHSYSHGNPPVLKEYFGDISRKPDDCIAVSPDDVHCIETLINILNEWNKINKTNITLNFK